MIAFRAVFAKDALIDCVALKAVLAIDAKDALIDCVALKAVLAIDAKELFAALDAKDALIDCVALKAVLASEALLACKALFANVAKEADVAVFALFAVTAFAAFTANEALMACVAIEAVNAFLGVPLIHRPPSYIRACPLLGDVIVTSDKLSSVVVNVVPPLLPAVFLNNPDCTTALAVVFVKSVFEAFPSTIR